jgi:hypothetical protein
MRLHQNMYPEGAFEAHLKYTSELFPSQAIVRSVFAFLLAREDTPQFVEGQQPPATTSDYFAFRAVLIVVAVDGSLRRRSREGHGSCRSWIAHHIMDYQIL